jgi:hypothetical protein
MFKKASELLNDTELRRVQIMQNSLCVIIPKHFCEELGIKAHDWLRIEKMYNGVVMSKAKV